MNVLVTYLSGSGNTEKVARAVYEGIKDAKELRPLGEVKTLEGYDLVFVGFPIIGRGAPRKVKKFLKEQASGKKVALFITHGMPGTMGMLKPMLDNCAASAGNTELLGIMDCQGKLVGWMSKVMRAYPNAEVRKWVRAGGESIGVGHPNQEDLDKAKAFGMRIMARQGQPLVG